jgi:hypothetical protein
MVLALVLSRTKPPVIKLSVAIRPHARVYHKNTL